MGERVGGITTAVMEIWLNFAENSSRWQAGTRQCLTFPSDNISVIRALICINNNNKKGGRGEEK